MATMRLVLCLYAHQRHSDQWRRAPYSGSHVTPSYTYPQSPLCTRALMITYSPYLTLNPFYKVQIFNHVPSSSLGKGRRARLHDPAYIGVKMGLAVIPHS